MYVRIEKATLKDLEALDYIENGLSHRILTKNTIYSTLENDTYYYLVAKVDDKIVGYLASELLVDHFDLLAVAVLENFRRQHIATLLLNKLFDICKTLQIKYIFLEVRCSNLSAIHFYEKSGFEKISSRKNYYNDTGEEAYIYKKVV